MCVEKPEWLSGGLKATARNRHPSPSSLDQPRMTEKWKERFQCSRACARNSGALRAFNDLVITGRNTHQRLAVRYGMPFQERLRSAASHAAFQNGG